MYLKDKVLTIHLRVPKELLDRLSFNYLKYKADISQDITFSEYLRIVLSTNT